MTSNETIVLEPDQVHAFSGKVLFALTANDAAYLQKAFDLPPLFGSDELVPHRGASPVDSLTERGLLNEEGEMASALAVAWRTAATASVVVAVDRVTGDGGYRWHYAVKADGYVEQILTSQGLTLLVGEPDQLAGRLALNSGLLRFSRLEHADMLDPLADDDHYISTIGVITKSEQGKATSSSVSFEVTGGDTLKEIRGEDTVDTTAPDLLDKVAALLGVAS